MKHAKLLSIFLILLIIIFSLVVVVNLKGNLAPYYSTPFLSQSLAQEMSHNNGAHLLNQTTRMQIYNFITNNPGINFRGICNSLTLPIGVVQYHLAVLMKGDLISNRRDGRNKRYFESKKFSGIEKKIISVLRHETAAKILAILHDDESASHGKLAQRLEISSQALTWHMKQLKEENLVTGRADGATIKYSLDETHLDTIEHCIKLTANSK
ncbi:MAG: winged helix-turn-helix transcriptional regulator [Candidatus Bathyarchaeota archaeon]